MKLLKIIIAFAIFAGSFFLAVSWNKIFSSTGCQDVVVSEREISEVEVTKEDIPSIKEQPELPQEPQKKEKAKKSADREKKASPDEKKVKDNAKTPTKVDVPSLEELEQQLVFAYNRCSKGRLSEKAAMERLLRHKRLENYSYLIYSIIQRRWYDYRDSKIKLKNLAAAGYFDENNNYRETPKFQIQNLAELEPLEKDIRQSEYD